ncbi:hypothetical protein PVAND_005085 [Polypedilum vanderplanki]|uniref:Uncharacterized protein n=1 Tax=Polypedilum vanderplanki TaxID=319348 RepID=A0A9J6BZA2_POLVA|nr:hypothetical protein PVAND_005085 [Polypedilum vanderplanki]
MDNLKLFIRCLLLDIDDYLQYIDDFGRPNYKYFNFVLNKLGIMHVFLYKSHIFKGKNSVMVKFIDYTFIALKKKFIEEKSNLKRAGLIFLISKVYFTDEIAINLKLRIQQDEWMLFKTYIKEIKNDVDYQNICLVFFQLFNENFFKFTLKNTQMALDNCSQLRAQIYSKYDDIVSSSTPFWTSIENKIKCLDQVNTVELKQLSDIKDREVVPFNEVLPEKVSFDEVFAEFSTLMTIVEKNKQNKKQVSRKEMTAVCRDYMKSTKIDKRTAAIFESDEDSYLLDNLLTVKPRKKKPRKAKKRDVAGTIKLEGLSVSTTSESDF